MCKFITISLLAYQHITQDIKKAFIGFKLYYK